MWTLGKEVVAHWYGVLGLLWFLAFLFPWSLVSERTLSLLVLWLMPQAALFLVGVALKSLGNTDPTVPASPRTKAAVGLLCAGLYTGVAFLISKRLAKRKKRPPAP